MKWKIALVLFELFVLVGCRNSLDHATIPPDCAQVGQVRISEVEETARGYAYSYKVYLPPCYVGEAALGYPVIYVLPGRGGGIGSWAGAGVNDIADALILAGEIPPVILVFTEDTNSDPFADNVSQDLIPHIEETYNVIGDRPHRTWSIDRTCRSADHWQVALAR